MGVEIDVVNVGFRVSVRRFYNYAVNFENYFDCSLPYNEG